MEKQVLVNESSLINIADVLRDKLGDTKTVPSVIQNPLPFVKKTSTAAGHDNLGGLVSVSQAYQVYTIPGASSILIKCSANINSSSCVIEGKEGQYSSWTYGTALNTTYAIGDVAYKETIFENTDTITIKVYGTMTYYMEICGLDVDGNEMPYYETEGEIEVANTFKPNEMAGAIDLLTTGDAPKFKYAYLEMAVSSSSITAQRNVDISEFIGTDDNKPFIFVLSLHTSTSSSSGSGVTVVTHYDGSKFTVIGSNVSPSTSPFSTIKNNFKPVLNKGILGLYSASTAYLNASRMSPYCMVLIYL